MEFMISWKIAPGHHRPAGEASLKSGAPMPEGLTRIGRRHAPGSGYGSGLVEDEEPTSLAEHAARSAELFEFQVMPVIEDNEAAPSLSKVYGN